MFDSPLPISYYKELAPLNEKSYISIVQHIQTGKIYIKKILSIYNINVYSQLFYSPVKNIPRLYALYENDNKLTIIEEYISGESLAEVLDICKYIPENEVIQYIIQLCKILKELHSFSPAIIHRDIKPSNIMLTEDGRIVLIDLNAAKQINTNQNRDTVLLGTEDFAAPEQFGFAPSSTKTDIYALGVLINTLLTGDVSTDNIYQGKLTPIINKCLQLSPKDRYKNVSQLEKALSKLI